MEYLFNATRNSRSAGPPPVVWGYPPGTTIVDLVPTDMKDFIPGHWYKFPPINPMWHYLLGFVYIIIGVVSISGNSLVLYLFTKTKDLRTPANMFVVNLAFSDLCMMISQFPMFVFNSFNGGAWYFGPLACEIYACTGGIFGLCSILTMAAISYDRYNVIVKGLSGTRITTRNSVILLGKACAMIAVCWTYAIGWSTPPFYGWGRYVPEGILDSCSFDYLTTTPSIRTYGIALFFSNYCLPLTIIVFCYYYIVRTIFAHEKSLREQAKKMNVASLRTNADQNAQSAEMRIAKIALINISLWVCMWTPYAAIVLQGLFGNQEHITPLVTILPALICKTASIYNPIIFAISHPKYRLALKETLPWFCIHEEAEKKNGGDTNSVSSAVTSTTSDHI